MARNTARVRSTEIATSTYFSAAELKAYYRFKDGASLLTDSTANNHVLEAIGVPVEGTPKFGTGCVGLGTSQAFSAVDGADFQPAGNFSVSAWIRTGKASTTQYIFQSESTNTNYAGLYFYVSTTNVITLISGKNTGTVNGVDRASHSSTNTVTNGAWHHVVGTYDGSKLRVYIDGVEEGTGTAWTDAAAFAATNYVRVGCSNLTGANGNYFQGALDEVSFFPSDALSLSEVQSLYAASITDASNATILAKAKAVYPFEDGAQLTDISGNGHTLTAIGTPTTLTPQFNGSVFLGNSSAYSAVDHADFQPTGAFTVGAWVKTLYTTSNMGLFQSYSANTSFAGILFRVTSGQKLVLWSGKNTGTTVNVDYGQIVSGTNVADGNWHFVVATWDGSYLRLYKDGVSNATPVAWANAPVYAATNYVRVGCNNSTGTNNNIFGGQLDDIFLLNGTALSDAQILDLYNGTISRTSLVYPRIPVGGVYIPGAKSIEASTGDVAITANGWIEDEKYKWQLWAVANAVSAEFDTAVTRTGAKTLKVSGTDATGRANILLDNLTTTPASLNKYNVPLKPSTSYTMTVWAKGAGVKASSARFAIVQYDASAVAGTTVGTSYLPTGDSDWTLLTGTFTSDNDAKYGRVVLAKAGIGIEDIWYDVNSMTLTEVLPRNPVV